MLSCGDSFEMLIISVSSLYRNSTVVVPVIWLCITVLCIAVLCITVLCIAVVVVSLSVVSWAFIYLLFFESVLHMRVSAVE
jgi:hypothetical protein